MSAQSELEFGSPEGSSGYDTWLAQRKRVVAELAKRFNLPVGHPVEIWLTGGVRLRGVLHLNDKFLFADETRPEDLQLRVDGVPFTPRDIESFVRQD